MKEDKVVAKSARFYGTGRRKSSVARVYLTPGTGKITINKKDMEDYFGLDTLKLIVNQPFVVTHGISRALLEADAENRPSLKKAGYLTRDSRMKERKKYGLKAARRAPQFSKR